MRGIEISNKVKDILNNQSLLESFYELTYDAINAERQECARIIDQELNRIKGIDRPDTPSGLDSESDFYDLVVENISLELELIAERIRQQGLGRKRREMTDQEIDNLRPGR